MKKFIVAFSFALTCITGSAQRLTISYDTAWFFTDPTLVAPAAFSFEEAPNADDTLLPYVVSSRTVVIDIDSARIVRSGYNQYPDCDVLDELFYFPLETYLNVMCYYASCDGDYTELIYLVTPVEGYVDGKATIYVGYFEDGGGYYGFHANGNMLVENYALQAEVWDR